MIKGIIRSIDDLGRLVVPKEMRDGLKMRANEPVDIYTDGNVICLRRAALSCVCCGSENEKGLIEHEGVYICQECLDGFVLVVEKPIVNEDCAGKEG